VFPVTVWIQILIPCISISTFVRDPLKAFSLARKILISVVIRKKVIVKVSLESMIENSKKSLKNPNFCIGAYRRFKPKAYIFSVNSCEA
jgi:hypothetical protein